MKSSQGNIPMGQSYHKRAGLVRWRDISLAVAQSPSVPLAFLFSNAPFPILTTTAGEGLVVAGAGYAIHLKENYVVSFRWVGFGDVKHVRRSNT
jgi:hypothetical protein